jgi:hypothetical protein
MVEARFGSGDRTESGWCVVLAGMTFCGSVFRVLNISSIHHMFLDFDTANAMKNKTKS